MNKLQRLYKPIQHTGLYRTPYTRSSNVYPTTVITKRRTRD